jgi:hypothetical protein
MSEENQKVDEKIDFNKIIEDKINPVLQSINQTKAELSQKLESVGKKDEPKKKPEKPFWDLDDDEDDEELTQSAKINGREMEKEVEKKIDKKLKIERDRSAFDNMAFQTYPELQNTESNFSKAVRKEMELIAQEMISYYDLDKSTMEIMANDPKIFYNAAIRVSSTKPSLRDPNLVNKEASDMYKGTNVGSTIKPVKKQGEINEATKALAKRLGVSLDAVKKYI